jgi:hypothetical protein
VRRLTGYLVYATKVKAGRRCVRIDYADGFHMDNGKRDRKRVCRRFVPGL